MNSSKIWLITGASQGLGLATVKYLLAKGQQVIATTRNKSKFDQDLLSNTCLEVINLDLTNEDAVRQSVAQIAAKYGRIDFLINNAGYGFIGAVEEAREKEIEQVMAVNVFATLRMIRHVLPYMRKAKSGHIINLSSIAGIVSAPGFGIYNASKYAVEGLSEAMSHELKDLGIKVTIVEPGAFRTNFLDSSLALASQIIDDYAATAGTTKKVYTGNNGKQPGDPEKAAAAIFDVALMENTPLRLLLGQDAFIRATKKLEDLNNEFTRMKEVSLSTGFEPV